MKIGFIGVGLIGCHMARNLYKGGHDLTIFDIRKEAAEELLAMGGSWADSPRDVAEQSEVVFTSLPKPRDVEEVAIGKKGILSGSTHGTVIFDLSTTDPDTIHRISDFATAKGIEVLDAPVSGGTDGAKSGTLCVMVGGDRAIYDRYKPVLDLIGNKVMYCGERGSGAICKIVNNLLAMSVAVLLSEAFTLGTKAGVPPETLLEAVSKSSGDTRGMHVLPEGLFKGDFEPGFQLDLGTKDVGLAINLARSLSVPMELSDLVQQRYIDAQNRGWGNLTYNAVIRIQEEIAGVEIRV